LVGPADVPCCLQASPRRVAQRSYNRWHGRATISVQGPGKAHFQWFPDVPDLEQFLSGRMGSFVHCLRLYAFSPLARVELPAGNDAVSSRCQPELVR